MKKSLRLLFILLLCGFALRIILMLWSFQFRENTDVLRYKDWGRIAYLYGPGDTYKTDHLTFGTLPNNQPPGTTYIISTFYDLSLQTSKVILRLTGAKEGSIPWLNGSLVSAFLRLPSLLADAIIAIAIYYAIKTTSKKRALIGMSLYYFNPIILYNSTIWGQMDSVNNVLAVLGLIFLFQGKIFRSIFSYLLSLFVKLSLIFYLPALIVLLLKKRIELKQILIAFIGSVFALLAATLPLSSNPINWMIHHFTHNGAGEMTFITNFAFNFWWFLLRPSISLGDSSTPFTFSEIRLHNSPLDSTTFMQIPLFIWGIMLFILLILPLLYKLKTCSMKNLQTYGYLVLALMAFLSFMVLPRMHERYIYPMIPLFATFIGLGNKFTKIFLILSACNLINLYITWHPMKLAIMPYALMNNQDFQWLISAITVLTGVVWYMQSLSYLSRNEKNT